VIGAAHLAPGAVAGGVRLEPHTAKSLGIKQVRPVARAGIALRAPAARKRLVVEVGAGGMVYDTKVRPDALTTGTSGNESVTASVCFVFPVDFGRAQIRGLGSWDGAERGRTPRDDEHHGAGEHRQDV